MKRTYTTMLMLLFATCWGSPSAQADFTMRRLGDGESGHASYWPKGLREALAGCRRVAGDQWDAPSFGSGMAGVTLCFKGRQDELNEFFQRYAKVEHKKLTVLLHPGRGIYEARGPLARDGEGPIPFDWNVGVYADGLIGGSQTAKVSVSYFLGNRGHLMGVEIPPSIAVRRGYDEKFLKAHSDDPSVRAIESFIRLRKAAAAKKKG